MALNGFSRLLTRRCRPTPSKHAPHVESRSATSAIKRIPSLRPIIRQQTLPCYRDLICLRPPRPHLPIHQRLISTKALPSHRSPTFRFFYRSFAYAGVFIVVSGALVLAFFIYDASTYREDLSYSDIPVSEAALNPKRGGPKNLPIAHELVDDDDCPENSKLKHKPKLVIVGTGWGGVSLLKQLNPDEYHVTVVSPMNYFLFTPMLPSATVGTLEVRSLAEPVRRIVQRARGHFLKAEAVDVEIGERLLEVKQTDANGFDQHFYLPYDKLVLGAGKVYPYFTSPVLTDSRCYNESSRCKGPRKLPFLKRHQGCSQDQKFSITKSRKSMPADDAR